MVVDGVFGYPQVPVLASMASRKGYGANLTTYMLCCICDSFKFFTINLFASRRAMVTPFYQAVPWQVSFKQVSEHPPSSTVSVKRQSSRSHCGYTP